jgi:hypothetical protein
MKYIKPFEQVGFKIPENMGGGFVAGSHYRAGGEIQCHLRNFVEEQQSNPRQKMFERIWFNYKNGEEPSLRDRGNGIRQTLSITADELEMFKVWDTRDLTEICADPYDLGDR